MAKTHLAFYFGGKSFAGERLEGVIRGLVRREGIRVYRTIDDLGWGLRQPGEIMDPLVLFPATKGDLIQLIRIRHLFMNHRVVLVLPDKSEETIARGHTLYPRYVSYCDGDFSDVAAVLEKMLRKRTEDRPIQSAFAR